MNATIAFFEIKFNDSLTEKAFWLKCLGYIIKNCIKLTIFQFYCKIVGNA